MFVFQSHNEFLNQNIISHFCHRGGAMQVHFTRVRLQGQYEPQFNKNTNINQYLFFWFYFTFCVNIRQS